jgi:hypothetical protein
MDESFFKRVAGLLSFELLKPGYSNKANEFSSICAAILSSKASTSAV